MQQVSDNYNNREFWIHENSRYAEPNFRLEKCARIVNAGTHGRPCDLLDVGCGPATLRTLLAPNINYHGLDIAIHQPAPYLREKDFVQHEISFDNKRFDIVVALGVFEYMGRHEFQKFVEIRRLLKEHGTFILSYINFRHFRRIVYPAYNNVHTVTQLEQSLEQVFRVEKCFPASHHWRHKQPGRHASMFQIGWHSSIPFVSSWLAVEYFCICSPRP